MSRITIDQVKACCQNYVYPRIDNNLIIIGVNVVCEEVCDEYQQEGSEEEYLSVSQALEFSGCSLTSYFRKLVQESITTPEQRNPTYLVVRPTAFPPWRDAKLLVGSIGFEPMTSCL